MGIFISFGTVPTSRMPKGNIGYWWELQLDVGPEEEGDQWEKKLLEGVTEIEFPKTEHGFLTMRPNSVMHINQATGGLLGTIFGYGPGNYHFDNTGIYIPLCQHREILMQLQHALLAHTDIWGCDLAQRVVNEALKVLETHGRTAVLVIN